MRIHVVRAISGLRVQQPVIFYQEGRIDHLYLRHVAILCQVSDSDVDHQSRADLVSPHFYSFSHFLSSFTG